MQSQPSALTRVNFRAQLAWAADCCALLLLLGRVPYERRDANQVVSRDFGVGSRNNCDGMECQFGNEISGHESLLHSAWLSRPFALPAGGAEHSSRFIAHGLGL